MAPVASKILGTVNAPYGANLSACQLAAAISDIEAAQSAMGVNGGAILGHGSDGIVLSRAA